jgi:hypothetical protein
VVGPAVAVDEHHPAARELLERIDALRVDLVADVAGDHVVRVRRSRPLCPMGDAGLEPATSCL